MDLHGVQVYMNFWIFEFYNTCVLSKQSFITDDPRSLVSQICLDWFYWNKADRTSYGSVKSSFHICNSRGPWRSVLKPAKAEKITEKEN